MRRPHTSTAAQTSSLKMTTKTATTLCSNVADSQRSVQLCTSRLHRVSKQNCAKLFWTEVRQISTNIDNVWQTDSREAEIMRGALICISPNSRHHSPHYRVKRRCSKLLAYTTLKVVICNKLSNDLISTQ